MTLWPPLPVVSVAPLGATNSLLKTFVTWQGLAYTNARWVGLIKAVPLIVIEKLSDKSIESE